MRILISPDWVLVDLLLPVTQRIEGLPISNIKDQHDSMGSFIVAGSNGPEAILAGRIPYLHPDLATVELDVLHFLVYRTIYEVYADCIVKCCCEVVLTVSHQQAGLTHS